MSREHLGGFKASMGKNLTEALTPKEFLAFTSIYTNYNINVSNIQTSKYYNLEYLGRPFKDDASRSIK